MTATMTDKQRQAVAAMEAARSQGCSLTDYAKANGLDVRRIFAILTMLRRRGLLPGVRAQAPQSVRCGSCATGSDTVRRDPERPFRELQRGMPDRAPRW